MLSKVTMHRLRNLGALFAFVLVVAAAVPSRAAVVAQSSAVNPSFQAVNPTLSLSATDYAWHSATVGDAASAPYLLGPDEGVEQSTELSDVVRHRGFRKALLILLICGGLIRFLTSPTYLKFIADALDPKIF